jgi:hypothetical protein
VAPPTAKVRKALPTAEDLSVTMTRTVREIESSAAAVLRWDAHMRSGGSDASSGGPTGGQILANCRGASRETSLVTGLPILGWHIPAQLREVALGARIFPDRQPGQLVVAQCVTSALDAISNCGK